MEIVKVYKPRQRFAWVMIVFGSVLIIFGAIGSAIAINTGFRTPVLGGDWFYLINTLQGVVFIIWGFTVLKQGRFFIGWSDNEIRYLLPGAKQVEVIKTADITDIKLKLFEVRLGVNDTVKILDLKDIEYKPLRKIKNYFEGLQSSISS